MLLIAALVTAVVVSAFAQPSERRIDPPGGDASTSSAPAGVGLNSDLRSAPPSIFVHVLGAVHSPGLFEVPAGSRVMDVVAQAGGLADTADQAGVNLARLVADGEQLYVPRVGESPAAAPPGAAPGQVGAPAAKVNININTGAAADLETLPRVGPMMAQRIIDYRTSNGPFASIDDLRNVTGIGEKTFEALKDLVTV